MSFPYKYIYNELRQIADQFEMHKSIVDQQRKFFNQQRKFFNQYRAQIQPDELMVIMDLKENIRLEGGPVECRQDYFLRQQCSVLGMAVVGN